jgi:uncharacterized protein YjbI with pentapeptide repeats
MSDLHRRSYSGSSYRAERDTLTPLARDDVAARLTAVSASSLLERTDFELASVTGLQLAGASLLGKHVAACRIVRTVLAEGNLQKTTFDDVEFEDCISHRCDSKAPRSRR